MAEVTADDKAAEMLTQAAENLAAAKADLARIRDRIEGGE